MARFPHSKHSKVNRRPKYTVAGKIKRYRKKPVRKLESENTESINTPREGGRVRPSMKIRNGRS
tara:strand:+ start:307 stop:498 length:192 start_codon:yes stop_codon:yes gene_type:complete